MVAGWEEMGFPPPAGHPAAEEEVVLYQQHAQEIEEIMAENIQEYGPINAEVVERQMQQVKATQMAQAGVGAYGLSGSTAPIVLPPVVTEQSKQSASMLEEYQFYMGIVVIILLILILWRSW